MLYPSADKSCIQTVILARDYKKESRRSSDIHVHNCIQMTNCILQYSSTQRKFKSILYEAKVELRALIEAWLGQLPLLHQEN